MGEELNLQELTAKTFYKW